MDRKELDMILENHKKWLETRGTDNIEGKQASLCDVDLSGINLCGMDLRCVNLRDANLSGANLRYSDLSNADLRGTDLRGADLYLTDFSNADLSGTDLRCVHLYNTDLHNVDLRGADLRGANLLGAYLCCTNLNGANLSGVDLRYSDLSDTDLRGADLYGADLSCTNLTNVKYDETTKFFSMICPEDGSFVGYKKAKNNTIVELLIPKDALRSSATSRKCRCSKAKVLTITNIDGTEYSEDYTYSNYDENFIYKVGEVVEVKDFDTDRWNECSIGIHFFMTRDEAVEY